ncbi:Na/Pi cotransporter family protein [Larkinella insperata]|uniref:Na/Pi cotransporter family protein n=1 Tax=Larkinella insperata TaxID=332158 RepID=A0ABW3QMJ1_9BACT|nr:Na/Pi symporter [Larkinella insperata]
MPYVKIGLLMLAGLVLFLFALNYLAEGLKAVSGEKMQEWLRKFTRTLVSSILVGVIVTTLLDSSSAVIIMTIALVNSRALTFRQAVGIVLGANIGTTFSSQLIAFTIGQWSGVPMAIGLGLMVLARRESFVQWGQVILGFGLLFLGLFLMEEAVEPLNQLPRVVDWMKGLADPWRGVLAGAGVTVLLQSSSATVGMSVVLAGQGLLTLGAGIAVMMGAELGTCADTLVASIGRTKAAVRTGLFHLFFNLFSILLGLLLIGPFTDLVHALSRQASAERQLANAHVLFNALGVLLVAPLAPWLATQMERWIPDSQTSRKQPVLSS